jgi:phage recombination protein Bet
MNDQSPRGIVATMAEQYAMAPQAFERTIRQTVMPSNASPEEFAAFLMVANKYGLNPLTREIYAFPKRGGGIQVIVSVDGWCNILNSHPAFDGMTFDDTIDAKGNVTAITCKIFRKDRNRPIECTEYLAECNQGTPPWKQWPRRMLRHKAMVQCARYAFALVGVIDPDEAERYHATSAIMPNPLQKRLEQLAKDANEDIIRVTADMPADTIMYPHDPETGEIKPVFDDVDVAHARDLAHEPTEPEGTIADAADYERKAEQTIAHFAKLGEQKLAEPDLPSPYSVPEPTTYDTPDDEWLINPESAAYKKGIADGQEKTGRCRSSKVLADPQMLANWRAGYESVTPLEASP